MADHTPEPWRSGHEAIWDSTQRQLLAVTRFDHISNRDVNDSAARANARRIVACVNACAGIATEELEATGLRPDGVNPALRASGREIARQAATIERLRTAYQEVYLAWLDTDVHPRHGFGTCADCDAIDTAAAALAETEAT